jgi:beta-glucosidase
MTPAESIERRDDLTELVTRLDLATKVRLISGASMWTTAEEPAIGLSPVTLSDGPIGVRGPVFAETRTAANFPCSTALAASWDDDLLRRVGESLAVEAARQGVDVVLGPTINLHRSPLGGRHFECFSEDPYLTGRLATAYVQGLQDAGIGACPKHFVANDAETDRNTVDNQVDERTLRELYLVPFEAVVADAAPWMIMSAYNGVNGSPMSENPLLADPLKQAWGWDGVVVSDWGGVYSTVESVRAAIDLAMPGPEPKWGEPLIEAVRNGRVDEAAIDDKVVRLLRLAARAGALNGGPARRNPLPAEATAAGPLVREAAVGGTVLLRNDGILPLRADSLRRVALIGPSALEPRSQGGGSAMVFPPYVVTPWAALSRALGEGVEIATAVGAQMRHVLRPPHSEELERTVVRWCAADGTLLAEESAATSWLYRSFRSVQPGSSSLEIATHFVPTTTGTWRLGFSGVGAFELELDGTPVLKETFVRDRHDMNAVGPDAPQAWVPVELEEGKHVEVILRYRWAEDVFIFRAGFGVQEVLASEVEELTRAAELARSADVAIVIVGTTEAEESEGRDRASLRLQGRQDELVAAVAAANPRTVVVVNAGSPVEMPWRDQVPALLVQWFPGMETGNALADVLLGTAEPGGRLPTTWPADLDNAPVSTVTPTEGRVHYEEGLHIGHRAYLRAGTEPAYWFGYGLGYTTWEYESLQATTTSAAVRVRNTGDRPGKQVVQVYVSRPESALDRPAKVLAGYTVVHADPGEAVEVTVPLDPRTLRHWHTETASWQVEAGRLDVHTGPHCGHLPLRVTTQLAGA